MSRSSSIGILCSFGLLFGISTTSAQGSFKGYLFKDFAITKQQTALNSKVLAIVAAAALGTFIFNNIVSFYKLNEKKPWLNGVAYALTIFTVSFVSVMGGSFQASIDVASRRLNTVGCILIYPLTLFITFLLATKTPNSMNIALLKNTPSSYLIGYGMPMINLILGKL